MEQDRRLAEELTELDALAKALAAEARVSSSVSATRAGLTFRLFVTLPSGTTLEGVGPRIEQAAAALRLALEAARAQPTDESMTSGVRARPDWQLPAQAKS